MVIFSPMINANDFLKSYRVTLCTYINIIYIVFYRQIVGSEPNVHCNDGVL